MTGVQRSPTSWWRRARSAACRWPPTWTGSRSSTSSRGWRTRPPGDPSRPTRCSTTGRSGRARRPRWCTGWASTRRPASSRCGRVRQARQGRRHRAAGARPHRGGARAARGRHGRRRLLVADDGRRTGGRAAVVGPGTQVGYHAYTFGYLAGEIVRRVTGGSWATSSPTSPPSSATPARSATAWPTPPGWPCRRMLRPMWTGRMCPRTRRCCGPRRSRSSPPPRSAPTRG